MADFKQSTRVRSSSFGAPKPWGAPASAPAPAGPGERVYDTPGEYTFEVPVGVSNVLVEVWGGGGGGGAGATSNTSNVGGGGGGGGYIKGEMGGPLIVPGSVLSIGIGAGGEGVARETGTAPEQVRCTVDVESSPVGLYAPTDAGLPAFPGNQNGTGGAGGTVGADESAGLVVRTSTAGTAGTNAVPDTQGGNGGAGAGPGGGAGGAGVTEGIATSGDAPGGGGGGTTYGASTDRGGHGAPGRVRISWPPA